VHRQLYVSDGKGKLDGLRDMSSGATSLRPGPVLAVLQPAVEGQLKSEGRTMGEATTQEQGSSPGKGSPTPNGPDLVTAPRPDSGRRMA
jgi:hypothetical protein